MKEIEMALEEKDQRLEELNDVHEDYRVRSFCIIFIKIRQINNLIFIDFQKFALLIEM